MPSPTGKGKRMPILPPSFSSFYFFSLFFSCSLILSFFSCSEAHEHTASAILPEDSVSMMTSYGVNTLISDSGVIKYRIVTERWDVNTIRKPSRWEFMKGIFFEQFDEQFHVQGYIQADTAWYFDQQRLWKLRGRVVVRNTNGLVYRGEELYWDGIQHEFYSNVFSRLVTPERTIQGTCFRSDENMNHYTVTNSKGSFVTEDMEKDESQQTDEAAATDSLTPAKRPMSKKHASSGKH